MTVIDAENLIMGRLASVVAKRLLAGERIVIVNAEKAVISGKKSSIVKEYKSMLEIKTLRNPKRGPKHFRRPDRILRDVVRGMLPKHNYRGRAALKRLKVYIGFPDEFKKFKVEKIVEADASRLRGKYVFLGEVAREIGWKGV
ncbi:MAG: 50S ribosomal protein L13 [Candidatus Methanomethylicota archaeon]|uniref:Large ribosomal subunit protein uL13 n=1 Tax=Thermoproteota archaeon TaxID=2056631 RepID=A0A497F7U0_9CREN|nr:MAG: 50S ribosomal protein L13 [Candidatus Verstraetearchaeota archaeon]